MRCLHVPGMVALTHVKGLAFERRPAPTNLITVKLNRLFRGISSTWRVHLCKAMSEIRPASQDSQMGNERTDRQHCTSRDRPPASLPRLFTVLTLGVLASAGLE
ncbi:hypothetical protein E6O75_ATG11296 [Venturia nashicola]|uniref:Uncharacterized protein n=1 Tax=Venturia nashicola TaxID=86259 RepID=A0A4Z1NRY1_9PEZI|nr:hypothetical protein E6O75_ATG11296 [Venturia nashicola]